MAILFANARNPEAPGFYFSDWNEYESKATALRIHFPVEIFDMHYLDGGDAELVEITDELLAEKLIQMGLLTAYQVEQKRYSLSGCRNTSPPGLKCRNSRH